MQVLQAEMTEQSLFITYKIIGLMESGRQAAVKPEYKSKHRQTCPRCTCNNPKTGKVQKKVRQKTQNTGHTGENTQDTLEHGHTM